MSPTDFASTLPSPRASPVVFVVTAFMEARKACSSASTAAWPSRVAISPVSRRTSRSAVTESPDASASRTSSRTCTAPSVAGAPCARTRIESASIPSGMPTTTTSVSPAESASVASRTTSARST
jgi:hypothetical protein